MVDYNYSISSGFHQAELSDNGTDDSANFVIEDGASGFYAFALGDNNDGEIDVVTLELPYGWYLDSSASPSASDGSEPDGLSLGSGVFDASGTYVGYVFFDNVQTITVTNRAAPVPCFTKGTQMLCADGETRAVEELRAGDVIKTLDNGLQPIRWIGKSFFNKDVLEQFPQKRPVRITAGVFGNKKDTFVSPQHRMLITDLNITKHFEDDEILVPAKALIDDQNITIDTECENVTYYHILLDKHEIICGDGAWSESFKPGKWMMASMTETTKKEVVALFPKLENAAEEYSAPARNLVRPGVMRKALKQKVVAHNIA